MSHARTENLALLLPAPRDDEYVAHAALVVASRRRHQSLNRAVDYLTDVADALGVDRAELAGLIVEASERRASRGLTNPATSLVDDIVACDVAEEQSNLHC